MKPFFNKDQTKSDVITKIPQSCASCGLSKKAKNGRMVPWGKFKKKILIISGAPTKKDDRMQKAWTGPVGDSIKSIFKEAGIHLFRDTITTYSCLCPIPRDAKPEDKEVNCCRKRLIKLIKQLKPKVIFLVGPTAVQSVIGKSWKKGLGGIDRWRGWTIPDRDFKAWICPISHPKYIETRDIWKTVNLAEVIWLQDIKRGLAKLDQPIKFTDEKKYITYIKSDKQFKSIIPRLLAADLMSFDYETTGIKPHAKGQQITNTAACIGNKECYSWMNTKYRDLLFKKVLESVKLKKSAHNISFEDSWSIVRLGAEIKNWHWDTMINSHILDNRKGVTGLKFQTYVQFGVADYDSHISPYLSSGTENGANSINKLVEYIKQYGTKPILTYCGLDAIYGFKLTYLQKLQIRKLSR